MERLIRPGECYRHFKNKLYQIVAVATHSETGERMVVYQALYGDFQVYVRPYDMFVSLVDRDKYPDVSQTYRFERVELSGKSDGGAAEVKPGEPEPNPAFLAFLEAETPGERIERLKALEETITQQELDSLYLVLDMKPEKGTAAEQVGAVRRYLAMQEKYDGSRLR